MGIDIFWDYIGQNENLRLIDTLFEVTVKRKLDILMMTRKS